MRKKRGEMRRKGVEKEAERSVKGGGKVVERRRKGGGKDMERRRKCGEKEEETGKKEVPSPDSAFIFPGRGSKTTFSAGCAKAGCRGSTPGHAAVLQNIIFVDVYVYLQHCTLIL
jgi:hypothetical protein